MIVPQDVFFIVGAFFLHIVLTSLNTFVVFLCKEEHVKHIVQSVKMFNFVELIKPRKVTESSHKLENRSNHKRKHGSLGFLITSFRKNKDM